MLHVCFYLTKDTLQLGQRTYTSPTVVDQRNESNHFLTFWPNQKLLWKTTAAPTMDKLNTIVVSFTAGAAVGILLGWKFRGWMIKKVTGV